MNCYNFQKKHIRALIFCFFALSLFSCGKDDVVTTVDPALESYLDRFLEEGAKRGKKLDIDKKGDIIMEFADLTPPTIGLCFSSLPVRIQIDKTYWAKTANSANGDDLRADLVFHELGHGLLKRKHKNDSLPNNEWKSMMCGEPQVNGRSWAVNFNGYRKNYYLDELFNENTSVPAWSHPAVFDGNKGYLLAENDYPSNSQGFTIKTEDRVYEISSSDAQNKLFYLYINRSITADFYMEVEMFASFATESMTGLFAGSYQQTAESYNYFTVSSDNRSSAANTKCIIPFAEVLISDKFQEGSYNKLAICKREDELFFYINDELVYRNDYQLAYNTFGVIIPAKGSISIRNQSLYSGQPSTLRAAQPAEDFSVILHGTPLPEMNYLK